MKLYSEKIDLLEHRGSWQEAINQIKICILKSGGNEDQWHQIGRIYQKLKRHEVANRAYKLALNINRKRPRTLNNLSILAMEMLNPELAESYLQEALRIDGLNNDEKYLLFSCGCQLRMFQLRHQEALYFANMQVSINQNAKSYSNLSVCLQWNGDLKKAYQVQLKAIKKQLLIEENLDLTFDALINLLLKPRESIQESIDLHIQLMNLGVLKLSCSESDFKAQQLLIAGMGTKESFWLNKDLQESIWKGQQTKDLILWDDQGFGDTIQNLGWLSETSHRIQRLRLWLRPSLIELTQKRVNLPNNVLIEPIMANSKPWGQNCLHLGIWYLPIILHCWESGQIRQGERLKRFTPKVQHGPIGLVWNAGSHQNPHPEQNARVRDVPFNLLIKHAQEWGQIYQSNLRSLQQGNLSKMANDAIQEGLIQATLPTSNWETTATHVEKMIAVVTVDTAMAHLCGVLNIPCVVLLNTPCDWRWGQTATKTSLYSSIRLARCMKFGNWSSALQQVKSLLHEMLGS